MSAQDRSRGFTLIELMVAIAIIAVLSAIGMVAYSTAQKTSRISKRTQDLQALQTALELYKSATGTYPNAAAAGTFACIGSNLTGLVPTYMPALPADPLDNGNTSGSYCYQYTSNATANSSEYKIRTNPTVYSNGEMNSAAFIQQTSLLDPAKDGTVNCVVESGATYQGWAIYNGGATTCAY